MATQRSPGESGHAAQTQCERCWGSQLECSNEKPSCSRCRDHGFECIYFYDPYEGMRARSMTMSPSDYDPSSSNQVEEYPHAHGKSYDRPSGSGNGNQPHAVIYPQGVDEIFYRGHDDPPLSHTPEPNPQEESLDLYSIGTEIFSAFQKLTASGVSEWSKSQHHLNSEGQRFRLWAYSMGLHRQGHASLDYRVRDVWVVKVRFADILSNLRNHLGSLLSIISGERRPLEETWDGETSVAADPSSGGSDSGQSSDSFHEVDFRQHSLTESLDALYSLASKIRNPRNRPQRTTWDLYKHIPSHMRDGYIQEREAAEIATVCHIQQKTLMERRNRSTTLESMGTYLNLYASPDNFLVRRIGIANARRKQQFVYWREHAARISRKPTTPVPADDSLGQKPAPEELGVGVMPQSRLGPTPSRQEAPPPSTQDRSLATSATNLAENFDGFDFDDARSTITHPSGISSTPVMTSDGPKLQWPPPPPQPADVKFFTCPYCHVICPKEYLGKDAWRSHVIHDLMPYQCTYESCSDPNRLYGSRQEWMNHENLHRRAWYCRVHEKEFETQQDYIRHLQEQHPDATPEQFSPELVAAAIGPSSNPIRNCPLCGAMRFDEVEDMQKHMRYHLERLALFILPTDPDDEDGGDASGRSSDSHQAIQGGGRQASLDLDFANWSSTASVRSTDPSALEQIPANPSAFDDIRRNSQHVPAEAGAAMDNWLMNLRIVHPGYRSPPPPFQPPDDYPPLPAGWDPIFDEQSNSWYYIEIATEHAQWQHPGRDPVMRPEHRHVAATYRDPQPWERGPLDFDKEYLSVWGPYLPKSDWVPPKPQRRRPPQ